MRAPASTRKGGERDMDSIERGMGSQAPKDPGKLEAMQVIWIKD
jgi:hypothetical protein